MASVVIVPPASVRGIHRYFRIWAEQYASAAPRMRAVVSLDDVSAEAVVNATRRAVARAGSGGEIVFGGHGGGEDNDPDMGVVNLAPGRAFRISAFVAYYDDRTQTWDGPSIAEMERRAERIGSIGGRRARRRAERAFCGRYVDAACRSPRLRRTAQSHIRDLIDRSQMQPNYEALCAILAESRLRRVVLMSCRVGGAHDFLDELATDFGVDVLAYRSRVTLRYERRPGDTRVWAHLEGDAPGVRTNNDRADTALMPGIEEEQYLLGRPHRGQGRRRHRFDLGERPIELPPDYELR